MSHTLFTLYNYVEPCISVPVQEVATYVCNDNSLRHLLLRTESNSSLTVEHAELDILSEVECDETIGGCGFDSVLVSSFQELRG